MGRRTTRPRATLAPLVALASPLALALLVAGCSGVPSAGVADVADSDLREAFAATFEARCVRCHGASAPSCGLSLTAERFERSIVNVWSYTTDGHLLVKPGAPEESFLIKVLRGNAEIRGAHAPPNGVRLSGSETELVSRWILSLADHEPRGR